jgi:hypothetical protein
MAFLEVFEDYSNKIKIYGKSINDRMCKIDVIEFCIGKVSGQNAETTLKLYNVHKKHNLGISVEKVIDMIIRNDFKNPLFSNTYRRLVDTPDDMGEPFQTPIMDATDKRLVWGDTQGSNSYTWGEFVALTDRVRGNRYTITTEDPRVGIIYGKVVLDTSNTFEYMHDSGIEEIIYIE